MTFMRVLFKVRTLVCVDTAAMEALQKKDVGKFM